MMLESACTWCGLYRVGPYNVTHPDGTSHRVAVHSTQRRGESASAICRNCDWALSSSVSTLSDGFTRGQYDREFALDRASAHVDEYRDHRVIVLTSLSDEVKVHE